MKVLVWSTGADTGGQGVRIEEGFARHAPDWTVTSLATSRSPLAYPEHTVMAARLRLAEARRLYALADVVHLHQRLYGWEREDRGQCKPIVLHHHGTIYRNSHGSISQQARMIGAREIASTLDLTLLEPGVEWVPAPYNLAELRELRAREYTPSDTIRIAHFPTALRIKSTVEFMAAFHRLSDRYPLELLTNVQRERAVPVPWAEVMAQKARADIVYDQAILGYGNNSVEAWGMGIPVIAGVADPKVRALMLERFGSLPFAETREGIIGETLEAMVQSAAMRQEYAQRGEAHVAEWHDDAKVVTQLQGIYRSAPPTHRVVLPRADPGWLVRRRRVA